jgi:hypothetical protein
MKIVSSSVTVIFEELGESAHETFCGATWIEAYTAAREELSRRKEEKTNSAVNQLMRTAAEMVNTAYKLRGGEEPTYIYRDYESKHCVRDFLKTFSVMTGEEIEKVDAEFGALVVKAFRARYPGKDPKKQHNVYIKSENRYVYVFSYGDEHLDILFQVYASKDWHKFALERLRADDEIPF